MHDNDFNSIAGFYNPLSKLVYGNRLIRAQQYFIGRLPTEGKVLLIGGGSGEILPSIWRRKPRLKIHFIDASQKMLKLAKKHLWQYPSARTNFICGTEEDIDPDARYDAILTFFFLDLFQKDRKLQVAEKLKFHLKSAGVWLHADFKPGESGISKLREKLMFKFFKAVSRIEADEIIDDRELFENLGMKLLDSREFGRGVYATVHQRK